MGQRGESLSAGERQLVALARAYVADPDLLVLDEATSAVDPATECRLTRALDTLTTRPDDADDRPPALDRRARRRGARRRRRAGRAARHGTRSWSTRRAPTRGCTPPGAAPRPASGNQRPDTAAGPTLRRRGPHLLPQPVGTGPAGSPPLTAPGAGRVPPGGPARRRPGLVPFAVVFGLLVAAEDGYLTWLTSVVWWFVVPLLLGLLAVAGAALVWSGRARGWLVLTVAAVLPLLGLLGVAVVFGAAGRRLVLRHRARAARRADRRARARHPPGGAGLDHPGRTGSPRRGTPPARGGRRERPRPLACGP